MPADREFATASYDLSLLRFCRVPRLSVTFNLGRVNFPLDLQSASGSRWCRSRLPCEKQILCFFDNFLAKVAAQILRGPQVDFMPIEQGRKLPLQPGHGKQAGGSAWEKLNPKIEVALRREAAVNGRPEISQAAEAALLTEGGQGG